MTSPIYSHLRPLMFLLLISTLLSTFLLSSEVAAQAQSSSVAPPRLTPPGTVLYSFPSFNVTSAAGNFNPLSAIAVDSLGLIRFIDNLTVVYTLWYPSFENGGTYMFQSIKGVWTRIAAIPNSPPYLSRDLVLGSSINGALRVKGSDGIIVATYGWNGTAAAVTGPCWGVAVTVDSQFVLVGGQSVSIGLECLVFEYGALSGVLVRTLQLGFRGCLALAVNSWGQLFVLSGGAQLGYGSRLTAFSADGSTVLWDHHSLETTPPFGGIAIDAEDHIYRANTRWVTVLSQRTGSHLYNFTQGLAQPNAVALMKDGTIVIADRVNGLVVLQGLNISISSTSTLYPPTYVSSSSTRIPLTPLSSSSAGPSPTPVGPAGSSSSISGGAIAGIVIGALVGGCFLVCFVCMIAHVCIHSNRAEASAFVEPVMGNGNALRVGGQSEILQQQLLPATPMQSSTSPLYINYRPAQSNP